MHLSLNRFVCRVQQSALYYQYAQNWAIPNQFPSLGSDVMREMCNLKTKRLYIETIEEAHLLVVQSYPNAIRHGSVGSWSWHVGDNIVAEAWVHPRKAGWWFKLVVSE